MKLKELFSKAAAFAAEKKAAAVTAGAVGAMAVGTLAHADAITIDTTDIVSDLAAAGTAVGLVCVAYLGVIVVPAAYNLVKRAIGR